MENVSRGNPCYRRRSVDKQQKECFAGCIFVGKHQGNGVQAIGEIVGNDGNGYQKTDHRTHVESDPYANSIQEAVEG